jgi:choline dehydrogenase-like flavoprotein
VSAGRHWSRRDFGRALALLAMVAGTPVSAAGASRPSTRERALMHEVSQIVIPRTGTPGACDLGAGDFVVLALAHAAIARAHANAAEMLTAAGCVVVAGFGRPGRARTAIHETGGARMGIDPATSVLNRWNQAHGVPNLFVTDSAQLSSSACRNPSLTYMALTARACDYAVAQLKAGAL